MVRNSRVDQPPVSGVPVAGAKAGSMESIYPTCEQTPDEEDNVQVDLHR